MIEQLKKFKDDRSLISYERSNISDNRDFGFVLTYSKTLVLLQHECDFQLDGLRLIRTSDITKIEHRKTDAFHQQMLKDDGTYDQIDFSKTYDLESWYTAFNGITKDNRFIIIEDEIDENEESFIFTIGDIQDIGKASITMLGFGTEAEWYETQDEIAYDKITCVQLNSDYIQGYERYFDRQNLKYSEN